MFELLLFALFSPEQNLSKPVAFERIDSFISEPAKIPQKAAIVEAPSLLRNSDLSVLALDVKTGRTLFEKSASDSHHIASLTKLLTYYVIRQEHQLDEVVMIAPGATRTYGAQIDLYDYEKISVETLLEAILIPSANDAAKALAYHNAGDEASFAIKLNTYAKKLGLHSAEFFNATGLDIFRGGEKCDVFSGENCEETLGNQMSAEDLGMLTRILLKQDPLFRTIIAKDHFYGQSTDEEFFHEKKTTNQFLLDADFGFSKGVKTGYTELAGECFINLTENENGDEFLTIVLGSTDRFGESKKLLQWVLSNFMWR